jgi:hypothetical protein
MREDLCSLLDRDTLLHLWPTLRTLISTTVRGVWEEAFGELRALADAPAGRPPASAHTGVRRPRETPALHARLLADVLATGSPYPWVITGGYAVQAHELLSRPSQDLDVASTTPRRRRKSSVPSSMG